ncbi:MAG TPA: inositol oxygenase family protein [Candidatus Binatia bacterium]|nr:inositol oxygenase family protein [Candidatus Binatia bacterium]
MDTLHTNRLVNEAFHSDLDALYLRNHRDQTMAKVRELRDKYAARRLGKATVWDRLMALRDINDESDADLEGMSQLGHALQTANSLADAGLGEDWIVTGLVHDLGKILIQHGEAQEFVVGDIFPVGCAYSPNIIRHDFLKQNPDWTNPDYQTRNGIYEEGCGLDAVVFSYGHDEYMYQIMKDHLPADFAWAIRYHSFQSIAGDYLHLFNAEDRRRRESYMKSFAVHDLYTKNPHVALEARLPEYEALIKRRFPDPIEW